MTLKVCIGSVYDIKLESLGHGVKGDHLAVYFIYHNIIFCKVTPINHGICKVVGTLISFPFSLMLTSS